MPSHAERHAIERDVLDRLRAQEGRAWREVKGEWQAAYDEFAIWILLYEDSDLAESHAAFVAQVAPVMDRIAPVQVTVGYTILKGPLDITVDTLMDSAEILHADPAALGCSPQTALRDATCVFDAPSSGLRPR